MPERTLDVLMDGIPVGVLAMTTGGSLSFAYADNYLSRSNPTPLSLSMPVRQQHYTNRVVLPFLQGLLPDNPLALESMARAHQVSASSPFALLEYVGHDVAGALQIVRPGEESEDATADRTDITPLDNRQLAEILRNTIAVYDDGAPAHGTQRMSLAGAQAKLGVAVLPDGSWGMPSRGVPTTHIFKPQLASVSAFPDSDIVELFCQNVVEEAGIPAAHTRLWQSPDGEIRAIVSERYDRRRSDNGTYQRLHQEDLCQAMSVLPSKKYQRNDGGPGLGQIGQLFTTRISLSDSTVVARSFLTALTANAALLNTDAHAKNYSLMLSGTHTSLAPMYDVLSIAAFLEPGAHPLFPMRLGKTYDLEQVFPETLIGEAKRLGISSDDATLIVEHTVSQLNMALDHTAQRMHDLDHNGIIARTIEGIRMHSSLLRAIHA